MDKSLLRHILTALGAVLVFIGLGKFTGLIDILNNNLDAVWDGVMAIVGAVIAVIGFFKNKARFKQA